MAETLEELTYNYEDEGMLVRKELDKVVLTKGTWATLMFLYQELNKANGQFRAPKIAIVRFKKWKGAYRKQSSFNVSSEKQARQINEIFERLVPQDAARRQTPARPRPPKEPKPTTSIGAGRSRGAPVAPLPLQELVEDAALLAGGAGGGGVFRCWRWRGWGGGGLSGAARSPAARARRRAGSGPGPRRPGRRWRRLLQVAEVLVQQADPEGPAGTWAAPSSCRRGLQGLAHQPVLVRAPGCPSGPRPSRPCRSARGVGPHRLGEGVGGPGEVALAQQHLAHLEALLGGHDAAAPSPTIGVFRPAPPGRPGIRAALGVGQHRLGLVELGDDAGGLLRQLAEARAGRRSGW